MQNTISVFFILNKKPDTAKELDEGQIVEYVPMPSWLQPQGPYSFVHIGETNENGNRAIHLVPNDSLEYIDFF